MAHHMFYPSSELPNQVVSYADTFKLRTQEFGQVTGNSAGEIDPLRADAVKLQPQADEIEQLQIPDLLT